jgi:hypothetical protein
MPPERWLKRSGVSPPEKAQYLLTVCVDKQTSVLLAGAGYLRILKHVGD